MASKIASTADSALIRGSPVRSTTRWMRSCFINGSPSWIPLGLLGSGAIYARNRMLERGLGIVNVAVCGRLLRGRQTTR